MKKILTLHFPTFLPLFFLFTTPLFSQDSIEIQRLTETARNYVNKGRSAEAMPLVDQLRDVVLRSVGADSKEYATYLHLRGTILLNLEKNNEAVLILEEALQLRKAKLDLSETTDLPELLKTMNNLGNAYYNMGNLPLAIQTHREVLNKRLSIRPPAYYDIAVSCNNLANMMVYEGEYDSAILYRNLMLDNLNAFGSPKPLLATAYFGVGNDCYLKGDFQKAIEYTRQSLNIREGLGEDYVLDVAFSHFGLGNIYLASGNYTQAIYHHQQGLDLRVANDAPPNLLAGSYNGLGSCYLESGNADSARICHQKGLDIRSDAFGPEHFETAFCLSNMGAVYMELKSYDLAVEYFKRSLDIRRKTYGEKHYLVARTLTSLAICHDVTGQYEQALEYLHESLAASRYDGKSFEGIGSFSEVIDALNWQAEVYQHIFERSNDLADLQQSRVAFLKAREAFDYRRDAFTRNGSEYSLQGDKVWITDERLIAVCYNLWEQTKDASYIEEAFAHAERSNSWALLESIKETEAIHFSGISDSLSKREHELRVNIATLEKLIFDEENKGARANPERLQQLSGRLLADKSAYEYFKKYLADTDSAYYDLRYGKKAANLETVQSALRPDQTLLEYFIGDSSSFLFFVRKNDFQVFPLSTDSIAIFVRQIRTCIDSSFDGNGLRMKTKFRPMAIQFAGAASALYRKLIGCMGDIPLGQDLILVPGGMLGYLPFELLLSSPPADPAAFHTHEYFVRKHRVSYNYSATLWIEMKRTDAAPAPEGALVVFAPYNGKSGGANGLNPLHSSETELKGILQYFRGASYMGPAATKAKFKEIAPKARIIHCITHGVVWDKNSLFTSYLAFYDSSTGKADDRQLFIREVYNLRLSAEMVVLSACETGLGEYQRGKGIISLARAFAYAGTRSIVTTLWKVNERSTQELMVGFYKHLHEGDPKDMSLWKAQNEYLNRNRENATYSHPYWWAGFIPMGDMRKIR